MRKLIGVSERESIKNDVEFLLKALMDYLEKMRRSLENEAIETFLRVYKQFNRAIGEIIGITKYRDCIPGKEHSELVMVTFHEIYRLLKEAHEIEEKFLLLLRKTRE